MKSVDHIAESLHRGERLSGEDAALLWREAPLWLLGGLALEAKRRVSGDKVFYNRNFHIEPTNICVFNCKFCSYRRPKGSSEAWDMSLEDVERIARERAGSGATEVHIVGGVHPDRDLAYYAEMIRRVKSALPSATVKAFTAVELFYLFSKAGISMEEGLKILIDAGMGAIPGGGAEIFDSSLRREICPEKCSAEEWLSVHDAAHRLGLKTNATILYGHVETIEQRIDHLLRLRAQQDSTGGFNAFVPLKFRRANNTLGESVEEASVIDDLKMLAMSRLILDNIPHIKAYWVMYGKQTAELALAFGADDVDGTIDDSTRIYSMAGAEEARPSITVGEIERMAANAGMRAVERDTHYNIIIRN